MVFVFCFFFMSEANLLFFKLLLQLSQQRNLSLFLNIALNAAEQLSQRRRIIWKNALKPLFQYSLWFGIIRQPFSGGTVTHMCQSTAEGSTMVCDAARTHENRMCVRNVNNAGVLPFLHTVPVIRNDWDAFFPPFYLPFYFVPCSRWFYALHMAD